MRMNVFDLFAGIGDFSLGLQRAGMPGEHIGRIILRQHGR